MIIQPNEAREPALAARGEQQSGRSSEMLNLFFQLPNLVAKAEDVFMEKV